MILYPFLSDTIPMHYGIGGTPDWLAATSMARWLLLPTIATFTAGTVYGSAWLIGHMQSGVQVPPQAKYDALSAADQRRVMHVMQRALYGIAGCVLVLFGALQAGGLTTSAGITEGLPVAVRLVMAGALMGIVGLVAGAVVRMRQRVDRLHAQREHTPS
jgi:uncharacterized membrane protein